MKKDNTSEFPSIPAKYKKALPEDNLFDLMPIDLVKEFRAFVFKNGPEGIDIAAVDPTSESLKDYLKKNFGKKHSVFKASEEEIEFIIENYNRDLKKEILALASAGSDKNGTTSRIINLLINLAYKEKASDVHIEPLRNETILRFRIDGVLQKILSLPKTLHDGIIARFKVLANLKIDETRRPQEGRIEPKEFSETLLRVSTVPTLFGEKIVLRILDDSNKNLFLRNLGFSEAQEEVVMRNIEKPFGMIIASGPTGSGKTTTLYALLQLIRKDGINISTLEDPIEFVIPGINQIQINNRLGLSFASGLRALLRQDPDVIMVGEIRDSDTAVMAADAAMTGHLVFSTIHTNNAPSVFVRLLEMGVEDFVIASTVSFIIAQRLVRKNCESCSKDEKLADSTFRKISVRKDIMSVLEKDHGITPEVLKKKTFKRGAGCPMCFESGYHGRIGIFELLELNKEIHDLILAQKSSEIIREAAEKNGFTDMVQDGVLKVINGLTTFEEVIRTTKNI